MSITRNFIVVRQSTGEVVQVSRAKGVDPLSPDAPDGMQVIEVDYTGPLPAYWTGNEVVPVPHIPGHGFVWHWAPTFAWVFQQSEADAEKEDARNSALTVVDEEAGKARLRYITSVPGQAETYTRKEQQAREWSASGFVGDAPPFIAAEAAALGRTPQSVAEEVIALADQWANVTGPVIEACRRKWKVAIEAATTIEGVTAARDAGMAELAGL